jgi:hypothetical protein
MTARLKYDEVKEYIELHGCRWISGEYKNNQSSLVIEFECGCKKNCTLGDFKNGRRCYEHARILAAEKRRLSIDEIIKRVESYGFCFISIIGELSGRETRIKYFCPLGHITERDYNDFYNHPTCGECKKQDRKNFFKSSDDKIRLAIKNKNCKLIKIIFYENRKNSELIIEFSCGHTENISYGNFISRRSGLCVNCEMESRSGETAYAWKGGITSLTWYIREKIFGIGWKEECGRAYGYKCAITGKPMGHVHHLQSFNLMLIETMNILNFEIKRNVSDYLEEELSLILSTFFCIQEKYPSGVPLTKNVHILFHTLYGRGNNTPEQFYEFVDRINAGEIQIPE